MKDQILKLVNDKFTKTRGGISLIQLAEILEIGQEELKTHLKDLYQDKKIAVHQSINLKLIYPYGK